MTARLTGTIARLPDGKRFGFIMDPAAPRTHNGDYFFHAMDVTTGRFEDLVVGDEVTFDATDGPRGLRAVNVAHRR